MSSKCIICDKEASGRYTCDIDVNGFGYCKKHKSKVSGLAMWAILVPELFDKLLKDERKGIKRTATRRRKQNHS